MLNIDAHKRRRTGVAVDDLGRQLGRVCGILAPVGGSVRVMRQHRTVVADEAWAWMEPLLPSSTGRRGGRWRDHRQVIEAIAWKYRTGSPWRELPDRYGPWQTAY